MSKSKLVSLNNAIANAMRIYVKHATNGEYIFKSRKGTNKAISRIQAYRIIRDAAEAIRASLRVSCHSLRKTFGYHAWKSGASPAVIMDIYNHFDYATTRRYLGLIQSDMDEVYHKLAVVI